MEFGRVAQKAGAYSHTSESQGEIGDAPRPMTTRAPAGRYQPPRVCERPGCVVDGLGASARVGRAWQSEIPGDFGLLASAWNLRKSRSWPWPWRWHGVGCGMWEPLEAARVGQVWMGLTVRVVTSPDRWGAVLPQPQSGCLSSAGLTWLVSRSPMQD
jgi:hypothetical protein